MTEQPKGNLTCKKCTHLITNHYYKNRGCICTATAEDCNTYTMLTLCACQEYCYTNFNEVAHN